VTAGEPRIKATWRFHQYTDEPLDKDVADFTDREALREWAEGSRSSLSATRLSVFTAETAKANEGGKNDVTEGCIAVYPAQAAR
jgi:hypothetical protein